MSLQLQIYGETLEKNIFLKLFKHPGGYISLRVCKEDGETVSGGCLLYVTTKGDITLCGNVSPDLGFDLDESGQLKIVND